MKQNLRLETRNSKPPSPARAAAFDILMRVEQGAFADEQLHSDRLKNLSPKDRALTTELVMGVLRWRSKLDAHIQSFSKRKLEKIDREIVTALRLGLYQLTLLTRVPERAAVHDSVELVKRARKSSAVPFANAVLRSALRQRAERSAFEKEIADRIGIKVSQPGELQERLRELQNQSSGMEPIVTNLPRADAAGAERELPRMLAEVYAHPAWVIQRWLQSYDDDGEDEVTSRICEYNQQRPVTVLRVSDAAVEQELVAQGVKLAPGLLLRNARRVLSGEITKTDVYLKGRVWIQDEASQIVALLVGKGSRVLDCCAAPGGKTVAMAERNPNSLIVAADFHPARAQLLRRRLGTRKVHVISARAEALPLASEFDRILADVPCSGTGTLARNPEIKWRLKPEDLADLHARQVAILRGALSHLAPSGRLVYSTCSLEPEENEQVIEKVLSGNLRLVHCREVLEALQNKGTLAWSDLGSLTSGPFLRTLPGVHPCDGFFAAVIERAD